MQALERNVYPARFAIKVFADTVTTVAGNGAFFFAIPTDVDLHDLISAEAYLSTVAGGATEIQIHNVTQAQDMLTEPITIDSGDVTSNTSASPVEINLSADDVLADDLIRIDVDVANGGMGLGVYLGFAPT